MIQPGSKIFTMSDTKTEWIPEAELADLLHVDRGILKKRRPHLPAGTVKADGNLVLWRHDAALACAAELGIPCTILPEKTAPAPASKADGAEDLTVTSGPRFPGGLHFPNPYVIQCVRANGELVMVRVGSSRNYVRRLRDGSAMKVRARKPAEGQVWVREGRDPRWPGKW